MAFENLGSFSTINQFLNRREQRKQNAWDRLQQGASLLGQELFKQKQDEKQRGFEGEQNALDRQNRMDIQTSADTAATERTRINEKGATQRQENANATQAEIAEADRLSAESRAAAGDAARMDQLQKEYGLRAQENAANDERYRTPYDDGQHSYHDPVTGNTYRWNSNEQRDFAMKTMLADQDRAFAELQAALAKDGKDNESLSDWMNGWITLRDETLADYDPNWSMAPWRGIPDETQRQRSITQFNDLVDGLVQSGTAGDAYASWLKDRFQTYVTPSEQPVGGNEDGTGGGTGGPLSVPITTDLAQAFADNNTGLLGRAATPFMELFARTFPGAASRLLGIDPESENPQPAEITSPDVQQNEQGFYTKLNTLVGNPNTTEDDKQMIDLYKRLLEAKGDLASTDIDLYDTIDEFLRSFEPARSFDFRPMR